HRVMVENAVFGKLNWIENPEVPNEHHPLHLTAQRCPPPNGHFLNVHHLILVQKISLVNEKVCTYHSEHDGASAGFRGLASVDT
ncbi:MAG: hypothetical protein ACR2RF_28595, partial [Geminicoccaceae bacterium]